MNDYKVIDPNGVFDGEKTVEKGEIITLANPTSRLRAWLRFQQVEQVNSNSSEKASEQSPKEKKPEESKK